MLQIRPITDLRNNFTEISKMVHESDIPVFLTKNGYGDMVVLSVESYQKLLLETKIAEKLKTSSIEAKATNVRFDFDEIANEMRKHLIEKI